MSKHTPKPWTFVNEHLDGAGVFRIMDKHGHTVGYTAPYHTRARANAALMTASPDLLGALRQCLMELADVKSTAARQNAIAKAIKAIAKTKL